jgi:Aldehyde dehydrogenase family
VAAKSDLALLMSLEQGKPLAEARAEITYAASFIEWYAEEAKRVGAESVESPFPDAETSIRSELVGVMYPSSHLNLLCRVAGVCSSDGEAGTPGQAMRGCAENRHSQVDNLARAAAKISFETFGSATILEIVSAPSMVATNTLADFFALSVFGSFIRSATVAIILRIPSVAADRVDFSALASSLPSAARGHP